MEYQNQLYYKVSKTISLATGCLETLATVITKQIQRLTMVIGWIVTVIYLTFSVSLANQNREL